MYNKMVPNALFLYKKKMSPSPVYQKMCPFEQRRNACTFIFVKKKIKNIYKKRKQVTTTNYHNYYV